MNNVINIISLVINKFFLKIRLSSLRNANVDKTSVINSGCNLFNVNVGRYSYCGYDCTILNAEIGSFCSIASGVIIGGAEHPIKFVSTSPVFLSHKDSFRRKFARFDYLPQKLTKIESDVWIGNNVLIKAGVTIGAGAIIGMGAVVTKDIPPYAIVGGNPAKIIKYRLDDELIMNMLKSKWWDLDEVELEKYAVYFNNPILFLKNKGLL